MLILDTDVLIEIERKNERITDSVEKLREKHPENPAVSSAIYAEVYYGCLVLPEKSKEILNILESLEILSFDKDVAKIFSQLKLNLNKRGMPIPAFDLITASTAIKENATVVSLDTHFKNVPNLKLILLEQ